MTASLRACLCVLILIGAFAVLSRDSAVASERPSLNVIQRENARPGTSSWKIEVLSFHGEIQGYASSPSVGPGATISFYVSTTASTFDASIYRMGWYHGAGARELKTFGPMPGRLRTVPRPQRDTGLIACSWPKSFALTIPKEWPSGIYLVKLTASNTHQGYIPFTVTAPASRSTFLFVHAVFTDEAYNTWGGKSLYTDISAPPGQQYADRAVKVSFRRPFVQSVGAGWFFSWEIHMVRWLERKGYDVSYATDLDVAQHPSMLLRHRAIIIAGHDEYWTRGMRNGMDTAVAHGVNLANFAANTGYWQVRLGSLARAADSVLVCYKTSPDPLAGRHNDLVTTEWRLPPLNRPESELTGAMYGGYDGNRRPYAWVVANTSNWVFRGTGLKPGSRIPSLVGQEADTVVPGYPIPPHLHVLSASPFQDVNGKVFDANSTIYRSRSGAWVFNAGTIDWSWGLDDIKQSFWLYPAYPRHPNAAIQIITRNILLRFGGSRAR